MVVDNNNNTEILRELFANFQPHLSRLTQVQQRLLKVLIDHPDGISSQEFTHLTGVLNKSDVLTPKLRLLLAIEHMELDIKRVNRQWHWKLVPMQPLVQVRK